MSVPNLGDRYYNLKLLNHLSAAYFTEVLGFCLMGNHPLARRRRWCQKGDPEINTAGGWANRAGIETPHSKPRGMRSLSRFNQRKTRKGAYWEDRYHATAVESGEHLARCRVYIDTNTEALANGLSLVSAHP